MSNNRSAELEKLFDEWRKRHISEDYSNDKISKNKTSVSYTHLTLPTTSRV